MPTTPLALLAADEGYQYITPGGIAFNLTALLIGMLLGGLLACILTVLHHAMVGRFFRSLIENSALSQENAKTLAELGLDKKLGLRRALRAPSSLIRKLVSVALPSGAVIPPLHSLDDDRAAAEAAASAIHAEEHPIVHAAEEELVEIRETTPQAAAPYPEAAADTPIDPDTAAYFLDDLHRRRAEIRFSRRGNEARLLIPAVIAFVALAATLPIYMPYFVRILDSLIAAVLGG